MAMKLGRMKKLKISEIDKSDLIVSVVPQLISFYEQGYQFDVAHMGETPLEQLLFAFNMNSKQVNIIDKTAFVSSSFVTLFLLSNFPYL